MPRVWKYEACKHCGKEVIRHNRAVHEKGCLKKRSRNWRGCQNDSEQARCLRCDAVINKNNMGKHLRRNCPNLEPRLEQTKEAYGCSTASPLEASCRSGEHDYMQGQRLVQLLGIACDLI
jgi:hypothetical protein